MHATYSSWLVALSIVIAVLVSYTALKLASRIAEADRISARWWLVGGATAMGFGIWAMHFIGMLAFSVPILLLYDIPTTLASLLIAIVISGLAIKIASGSQLTPKRLILGGLLMGLGISAMHYTGMAAIEVVPEIRYQPWLVAASVAIAVGASIAALWLAFNLRHGQTRTLLLSRLGAAVLMGLAIAGMHYTGMAASAFATNAYCLGSGVALNNDWLSVTTAILAIGVLVVTLITDVYSAELASRSRTHALRLEEVNADLHYQATHDALTGLPNRVLFFGRLNQSLAQATGSGRQFAVMVLDLDRFKLINDSLGHVAGDALLVNTSRRLTTAVRKVDTVARVGGDEFLVLVSDLHDRSDATLVAQKIVEALAPPCRLDSIEVQTTPSIGISLYPEDGADADALLAHADEAMYFAKQRGGNTFQCFSAQMKAFSQERLQFESELRRALALNQFELYYQPKVDLNSGRIGSVEALIRWHHPVQGMLLPDSFIPVAEQTGLILPIGEWVLHEACRQARAWQMSGTSKLRVAVNLSAVQFRQPNLLDTIRGALNAHQLAPSLLEIELTETSVMTNAENSVDILEQLSRMGVIISVDDFGTGYSSMSYLRRFPIDKLKIDSSFVAGLGADGESAHIVQAIISLAHSLKMKVIAEGVEAPEQVEHLKRLGCDQCQGNLFSIPRTAAAFEEMLRDDDIARQGTVDDGIARTYGRLLSLKTP
ncbi:MAG TPA: EAL domain-containing protein [Steroidobacteraceae bacterium]|jgi:diguanylate cyclase (GGDEF)-like protein|nr:EAL domain-containing protein [Steroidobacteraceae bacterium]